MIQYDESFDDDSTLPSVSQSQSDHAKGQVQFCHNLIANLFEKRKSPCNHEIPELIIRSQILEHYLPGIINITSYYGMFTFEILLHKQIKHHIEYKQITWTYISQNFSQNF